MAENEFPALVRAHQATVDGICKCGDVLVGGLAEHQIAVFKTFLEEETSNV